MVVRLLRLNLLPGDALAVHRAMDLLQRYATAHHEHVMREIREVTWSPSGVACPSGSLACTGGRHDRTIVMIQQPSKTDLVELAVTLSHEARHHYTDPWGRHFIIEHACVDCSNPYERACDDIYVIDDLLRYQLRSQLTPIPVFRRCLKHIMSAGPMH